MENATTDIALSVIDSHESFNNIWIADSGASCHFCNSDEGLFDQATISEMITVGNGSTRKAEKVGKLRIYILQCDGRKFEIKHDNVKFVPVLWINLSSISKSLTNGFMIGNEGALIKLTNGEMKLVFNQHLNTKGGFVSVSRCLLF
jgi:hypothetical protein